MSELRVGDALRVGEVVVIPVEKVWVRCHAGGAGLAGVAGREPVVLVIREGAALRCVDLEGEPTSLGRWLSDVPGLREVLDGL